MLPVSIRPAVVDRMVDSIQFHVSVNISETELVSAHKYAIDPMHFVESVLPNVNSPFWFDNEFVGSNYEDEVKFDSSLAGRGCL